MLLVQNRTGLRDFLLFFSSRAVNKTYLEAIRPKSLKSHYTLVRIQKVACGKGTTLVTQNFGNRKRNAVIIKALIPCYNIFLLPAGEQRSVLRHESVDVKDEEKRVAS